MSTEGNRLELLSVFPRCGRMSLSRLEGLFGAAGPNLHAKMIALLLLLTPAMGYSMGSGVRQGGSDSRRGRPFFSLRQVLASSCVFPSLASGVPTVLDIQLSALFKSLNKIVG